MIETPETHEVEDGARILRFPGRELGFSSSKRPGVDRWIEFTLYQTIPAEGSTEPSKYVLSRIGVSNVYHHPSCETARRAGLREFPKSRLTEVELREIAPCPRCRPDQDLAFPLVCLEEDKAWARIFRTPEEVLRALTKTDEQGNRYLTRVAKTLLTRAAFKAPELRPLLSVQV